nr:hypothetical protein MtrunA17_Chr5g0418251 [Ipomoea trifida]
MLLTIFCLASSLTAHRSEKRIIFNRCLAMFALEFLLDSDGGNIIFQAKLRRSKKLMLIALRRKLSNSWPMEFEDSLNEKNVGRTFEGEGGCFELRMELFGYGPSAAETRRSPDIAIFFC